MSINRVVLSGNLTRDPELRYTKNDKAVLSMTIASNKRVKNSSGEWEDEAVYVDCTMFGARAEGVSKHLRKGSHATVDGKLRYSVWEKDGQKRNKLDVIVDDIDFKTTKESSPAPEYVEAVYADENIPF